MFPIYGSNPWPGIRTNNLSQFSPNQLKLYEQFQYVDSCVSRKDPVAEASEKVLFRHNPFLDEDKDKFYPKDPLPLYIHLPFHNTEENHISDYVETPSLTLGNRVRKLTQGRQNPKSPGWLIEIPEIYFNHIREIQKALDTVIGSIRPFDLTQDLHRILTDDMKLRISEDEICEVLKRIPLTAEKKFSYPHFMFGIANPAVAAIKHVFLLEPRKCLCAEEDLEELILEVMAAESKIDKKKKRIEIAEALNAQRNAKGKKSGVGTSRDRLLGSTTSLSGYTAREKILYSVLFYTRIYGTMKKFKKIYSMDYLPPTPEQEMKKKIKLGFLGESVGTRNRGFAEWDRVKTKVPKISPYLAPRCLVNSRWKLQVPNHAETRLKDKATRENVHLVIQPPDPDDPNGPILMFENRKRIRHVLKILSYHGDCVAKLPDVDTLISLGNVLEDVPEQTVMNPTYAPVPPKLNHSQDIDWINDKTRRLFLPFKLPEPFKKLPMIPVKEARILRKNAAEFQQVKWKEQVREREVYRKELWKRLDVERIPCGKLKDSFMDVFLGLIPLEVDLPHEV